MRVINKRGGARRFVLGLEGLAGARLEVVGAAGDLVVPADATSGVRVLVFAPPGSTGSAPLAFRLTDPATGETAVAPDHFKAP